MERTERVLLWQLEGRGKTERLCFPWKRLLARTLDLFFYLLLWWTVAYLGFRWNMMLYPWIPRTLAMILISVAVMVILEPPVLALFGTTPGKALLGITVKKPDGRRLSLGEAYRRLFRLLRRGCGYVVVPGLNFVRMYHACKRCEVEGETEWDEGFAYSSKGSFPLQIGLGVVYTVLIALLMTAVYFGADMPVHRGSLTAAELEENVATYWSFHGKQWNTELFYTVSMQFYERSAGYIFDRMDPPHITIEEKDGAVTAVSFEFHDSSRIVLEALPVWLRCYTVSFVGAQRGMNFIALHAPGGPLDQLLDPVNRVVGNRVGTEEVRFVAAGVSVSLDLSVGELASATFRMELLPSPAG